MSEFSVEEANSEEEPRAGDSVTVCLEIVGLDPVLEVSRFRYACPSNVDSVET